MATSADISGRRLRVRGLVQGVGFRPHVWRLANELALVGQVANDGEGVLIDAWGVDEALDCFHKRISGEAPPLARVDRIDHGPASGPPPAAFTIAQSVGGAVRTGVVPDAATCPACRAELFDPADRRQGYAFGNCTHCGPRLSIVRAIPYDRANTAMAPFEMCADCRAEYDNPADRRFHAQPTACPQCGPSIWIEPEISGDPIAAAAELIADGGIMAIKGIGGFHLACDARNAEAVAELRRRKARDAKPFALMVADLEQAATLCTIDSTARNLLQSAAAPVVLLPIDPDAEPLPSQIAPGQDHLGVMLAYSPLHHLLLAQCPGPLVMTSGNRSDEPQVISNTDAREQLAGIADAWLMHDRDIVNRIDDSVVALDGHRPVMLRRARGYAPAPIALPAGLPPMPRVLAMGGELKATFCLLDDDRAIVSQHIGDLEHAAAIADYRAMIDLYRQIFDFTPEVIAVDQHADYLSTQLGTALAEASGATLVRVAHHHAHMAACLADAGQPAERDGEEYFGILLDGLGLGPDGTLWGGEVLAGGYRQARRVGGLPAIALPGGAAAMREPWRNLVAHLHAAFGGEWRTVAEPLLDHLPDQGKVGVIERMIETGTNAPLCSSTGRLFDAVAAALGIHPLRIGHEAQAAMELEALARPCAGDASPYPLATGDWPGFWRALIADRASGVSAAQIAARFHLTLAAQMAQIVADAGGGGRPVALSGGVFQNRVMLRATTRMLEQRGCTVLRHRELPANDGGLSLGQAIVAGLHMAGGG